MNLYAMVVGRKVITRIVPLASLFVLLTACEKDTPQPSNPSNPGTGGGSVTANEQKMQDLVNQARAQGCNCGNEYMPPVAALTWNDQLENAARSHSEYQQQTNTMSHSGANGSDPGDRITAAGYNWRTYGENVAMGYADEEAVMKGWLNSPGHCKNIMNGDFKEMGQAAAGRFWTQNFATKR